MPVPRKEMTEEQYESYRKLREVIGNACTKAGPLVAMQVLAEFYLDILYVVAKKDKKKVKQMTDYLSVVVDALPKDYKPEFYLETIQ